MNLIEKEFLYEMHGGYDMPMQEYEKLAYINVE